MQQTEKPCEPDRFRSFYGSEIVIHKNLQLIFIKKNFRKIFDLFQRLTIHISCKSWIFLQKPFDRNEATEDRCASIEAHKTCGGHMEEHCTNRLDDFEVLRLQPIRRRRCADALVPTLPTKEGN